MLCYKFLLILDALTRLISTIQKNIPREKGYHCSLRITYTIYVIVMCSERSLGLIHGVDQQEQEV